MQTEDIHSYTKPDRHQDLHDRNAHAIERVRLNRQLRSGLDGLCRRYEALTQREREVMSFLVKGLLNKQVGAGLGMTLPTVKFHRAHVMQKMKAGSIAELVRLAGRLEAHTDEQGST